VICVHERLRALAVTVGAATLGILLMLLGLWIAGYAPVPVVNTWLHAAAGSRLHWAMSLQEAGPLLFAGLATAIAFRANVLNIGVEGQYLLGAITFIACGTRLCSSPPLLALPLALSLAMAAGACWAMISYVLERTRGVPIVLSTILLNFIAVGLISYLVEGPLHDHITSAPQTDEIPSGLRLPVLIPYTKLHVGILLAFLLAGVGWLVQTRTVFGFELGVVGANDRVARLSGIHVERLRSTAMLLSGAIAGLGGAIQQAGVTYYMSDSSVSYGYAGIAVALLGRLHPAGVAVAAIYFGLLDSGSRGLERDMGIPHDVGDILKGVVTLIVLMAALVTWRRRAPVPA
jgi:ABC-type uncharacterized transport system permease subunit